jgi:hypothetical protein
MIEYSIAYGSDVDIILAEVKEMIEQGWRPQGGLAIIVDCHAVFYQAMIRQLPLPKGSGLSLLS